MKNTVTTAEVRRIAALSKLELKGAESEKMREHLNRQAQSFEIFDTVDTCGVPPTAHIVKAVE